MCEIEEVSMKKFGLFLCIVLCVAFMVSGCDLLPLGAQPNSAQPEDQPSGTVEQPVDDAQYEVVYMDNPDVTLTDVYVQNIETKAMEFFATIPNVNKNHYHSSEYHNGNVYIIRRTGDTNTDSWQDELWRHDEFRAGTLLYAIKGLDFRVSPSEVYVAVNGSEKLIILDAQGNPLQEYLPSQVLTGPEDLPLMIGLLDWSDDSSTLWLETDGPVVACFTKVAVPSWQVTINDLAGVPIGRAEYELNPNTSKVVFSDLRMFFAADTYDEFKASGEAVTLYVYDLANKSLQQIAVSKAEEFEPVWLDDVTIEYNDPVGEGRITSVVQ
jgi:hypothetical protein